MICILCLSDFQYICQYIRHTLTTWLKQEKNSRRHTPGTKPLEKILHPRARRAGFSWGCIRGEGGWFCVTFTSLLIIEKCFKKANYNNYFDFFFSFLRFLFICCLVSGNMYFSYLLLWEFVDKKLAPLKCWG